jgi:two-component system, cell cycle sensor histidine kinase and response regulator CckA
MSVSTGEIANTVNQGKPLALLKDGLRDRNESGSGKIHGGEGSYQTVLIVNDNQDQLDLMSILLRQSGYQIITAEDGCEGYEVALAERPDLVISDVSMPRMNGIEMCGLIRENEDLKRTPVLLISAVRKDSESAVQGLKAGADDYLEAPYDPTRLVERVSQLIERRRGEGSLRDIADHRRVTEALSQSERRFRAYIENASDNITVIATDGTTIYESPSVERITGYKPEELVGTDALALVHPEDREKITSFLELGFSSLTTVGPVEYRYFHKDGSLLTLEAIGKSHLDEKGELVGIINTRDITERKRAEVERARLAAEVEHQRQRLKGLVANVPGVVWEASGAPDEASQSIDFVNDYTETMLGYSVQEWLQTPNFWLSIVHEEDRERAAREAAANFSSRRGGTSEFRWVTRDGRVLWVEAKSVVIIDEAGKPTGMRGVTMDITERKRAEQELRESEERYRETVENARDMIYTHDLEGNYTSVNKASEQITGYTREEARTMNIAETVAPEYLEKARSMLARKLEENKETVYDLEIIAKDGHRIAVEVNTRLVYRDGIAVGVQGIARDIRERKHLEEQLRQSQKMEAVGRLAGGVAHDFNNLLTVINGYSELTLRRLQPEDALTGYLEEIKKAGTRAASLTRQLLAFSRKQVLQPKVLDLNAVISDVGKMLERLIGEDIDLRTVLKPELRRVNADPGQIEQVIMNLVVNARDAMPDGGKLIIETGNAYLTEEYARHHVAIKPGPYVMLAVSDNGSGMNDETKARLFEPFFTTKEQGKGTGLGLSTAYGIVKQSLGYIWVYSEVGSGTTFKVYLPAIDEKADSKQPAQTSEPIALGSETILLVEDDEMVRGLARTTLEEGGYKVLQAANGAEALLICEQYPEPIHLLLTDVVMPGMSGRAVADRLKTMRPQMLVLYMSGYTEDAIVHHGVLNEGVNFIEKPFDPTALTRKVREVLDAA